MKIINRIFIACILVLSFVVNAFAEESPADWRFSLTLKNDFHSLTINLDKFPEFFIKKQTSFLNGQQIKLPEINYCPEDDQDTNQLPVDIEIQEEWTVDLAEVEAFLIEKIAPKWNQEAQNVRIYRDEEGNIQFDGLGIYGEFVNISASAKIIEKAIYEKLSYATLMIDRVYPEVIVEDEELKKMGINDLIAVGESDFSGSPVNRIHNIHVGAKRFTGVLVLPGETFSFNNILQEVSARMGYRKELVIKGEKTVPDYGGGLCQVSTTAFRAALLAGVEIVERWPHAYAVTYYTPWGSDATIYLGGKDFKFLNDTKGAILIQAHIDENWLSFHFYGTLDDREVALYGPYIGRWRSALPKKVEYTDKLAPGETQLLSGSHTGFDATWYQSIKKDQEMNYKLFFSRFEPRGLFYLVGSAQEAAIDGGSVE